MVLLSTCLLSLSVVHTVHALLEPRNVNIRPVFLPTASREVTFSGSGVVGVVGAHVVLGASTRGPQNATRSAWRAANRSHLVNGNPASFGLTTGACSSTCSSAGYHGRAAERRWRCLLARSHGGPASGRSHGRRRPWTRPAGSGAAPLLISTRRLLSCGLASLPVARAASIPAADRGGKKFARRARRGPGRRRRPQSPRRARVKLLLASCWLADVMPPNGALTPAQPLHALPSTARALPQAWPQEPHGLNSCARPGRVQCVRKLTLRPTATSPAGPQYTSRLRLVHGQSPSSTKTDTSAWLARPPAVAQPSPELKLPHLLSCSPLQSQSQSVCIHTTAGRSHLTQWRRLPRETSRTTSCSRSRPRLPTEVRGCCSRPNWGRGIQI